MTDIASSPVPQPAIARPKEPFGAIFNRLLGPGLSRSLAVMVAFVVTATVQMSATLGPTRALAEANWGGLFVVGALGVVLGMPGLRRSDRVLGWLGATVSSTFVIYFALGLGLLGLALVSLDSLFPATVGVAVALSVGFACAQLEALSAWRGAWNFRTVRAALLILGALGTAANLALTAAMRMGRALGHAWAGSVLEGLVPGVEVATGVLLAVTILWGELRCNAWLAKKQLAGAFSERAASEALWFTASLWTLCSWVMLLVPTITGGAPQNLHSFQAAALGAWCGGLVFPAIFLAFARPGAASIAPLVIVLPEQAVDSRSSKLAAQLARGWQHGPVTLLAHPRSARRLAGLHLRTALAAGSTRTLFPNVAADVEHFMAALPPAFAWLALRRRECFPRPGAWEATLRTLVTEATRVVVLAESLLAPESKALLGTLARCAPASSVVVAAPWDEHSPEISPNWDLINLAEQKKGQAASLVLATLRLVAAPQALRQIAVGYEEAADGELAAALVAELDGRRDRSGTLIEAWSERVEAGRSLIWLLRLRGSFGFGAWKWFYGQALGSVPRLFRLLSNYLLGYFFVSNHPAAEGNVFVMLERPVAVRAAKPRPGASTSSGLEIDLSQLLPNLVAVRVGQPFAVGEASRFRARAQAGWLAHGANLALNARDVAERLFANATEPLADPGPWRDGDSVSTHAPALAAKRVFLSHSDKDRWVAEQVVEALEAAGIDVWSHMKLASNEAFGDRVQAELEGADVVVVLWTASSVTSSFVRAEARHAGDRLFQVAFDNPRLPLPFDEYQSLWLTPVPPAQPELAPRVAQTDLARMVAGVLERLGSQSASMTPRTRATSTSAAERSGFEALADRIWGSALVGFVVAAGFLWWLPRNFAAELTPSFGVELPGPKMSLKFPVHWITLASLGAAALLVANGFAVVQHFVKTKLLIDWKVGGLLLVLGLLVASFGVRPTSVKQVVGPNVASEPTAPVPPPVPSSPQAGAGGAPALVTPPASGPATPSALATLTLTWPERADLLWGTEVPAPTFLTIFVNEVAHRVDRGIALALPVGPFTLEATGDNRLVCKPVNGTLTAGENQIAVSFIPRWGRLDVTGADPHQVVVDGKEVTPAFGANRASYIIFPGGHTLTIKDPKQSTWSKGFSIRSGERKTIAVPAPKSDPFARRLEPTRRGDRVDPAPPPTATTTPTQAPPATTSRSYCAPGSIYAVASESIRPDPDTVNRCQKSLVEVGYAPRGSECLKVLRPAIATQVRSELRWLTDELVRDVCACATIAGTPEPCSAVKPEAPDAKPAD